MSTDFDILPDKVEVIKYHRFENNDIQSEEVLKELISLMFDHPERDFYVFAEKNSKPNTLLMKANKDGEILINEGANLNGKKNLPSRVRCFSGLS
jgi:hypothetical protein